MSKQEQPGESGIKRREFLAQSAAGAAMVVGSAIASVFAWRNFSWFL